MKLFSNCKLLKAVITTIIVMVFTSISFAGAWPEKQGGGYYKLSFRYLKGDKIYNESGDKVPIPDFTDITFGFYGTYGLTDDITLSLNASLYKSVKQSVELGVIPAIYPPYNPLSETEVSGFGDIGIGAKYGFARIGKTVFSTNHWFPE